MSKIVGEIYHGWKNLAFKNPKIERVAKKRLMICLDCNHLRINNICSKCGCYVFAKVRSPRSKCPLNEWPC